MSTSSSGQRITSTYYEVQTPNGVAIYKDKDFIPFSTIVPELTKLSGSVEDLEKENNKLKSMIFDYVKELQKKERDQEALRDSLRKLTQLYEEENNKNSI